MRGPLLHEAREPARGRGGGGVEAGAAGCVGIGRAFSATFSAGAAAIDGGSDCFRSDTAGGRSVAFVFVDGGDGIEHVEVGYI